MTYLKSLLFASALMLASVSTAQAEVDPDILARDYTLVQRTPCSDIKTGDRGWCFMFEDHENEGYTYVVFVQDGVPVWIRYANGDSYTVVWPKDEPKGIAL